jgi:3-oxoacyl-[acyl-carrier-protein] synthase II
MKRKRIVVTGMGVTSCFGNDVEKFYQMLCAGQSGVKTITHFDCEGLATRFAASIPTFDPGEYLDKKQARRVDKFIAYTVVAGKKALEHGGIGPLQLEALDKARCGVIIGSGIGGMNVYTEGVKNVLEHNYRRISPFFIPYTLTNMGGGLLAIDIGFMGPNYSISTACATGNYSIIAAAAHIRNGEADLMLCGGAEAPVSQVGLGGFCALKALSTLNEAPEKASRPWNIGRDGFVIGEGAGVLVLESLEHALKRGATIYAEYLGGGCSCDAYHMTELRDDAEGLVLCMNKAFKDAGVSADEVNFVNAHATSTPQGDMVEIRALQKVFSYPEAVAINATKSMTGHALGAAGGLEAVATVMAVHTGRIHPTINFENPEPDLRFEIPTQAVEREIRVAMSNSFGFGGHNASVLFAPYR